MSNSLKEWIALALLAARKEAGFDTAESAAIHFGWSVSRYRAHESGTRNILEDDLVKYAQGFGLPLERLARPDPRQVDRKLSDLRVKAENQARQMANRLRCARILRGYRSARTTAPSIGVKTPTYLKHENGENRLSGDAAEFYARSFGISLQWLQMGSIPSGLGAEIDRDMRSVLRHPEAYLFKVEPSMPSLPTGETISLKPGRPQKRTLKIPEYKWSDIEANRADLRATKPSGVATLPMLPSEEVEGGTVFLVVVDEPGCQLPQHSRVIVSPSGPSENGSLVYNGCALEIFAALPERASKSRTVLGRVIGQIDPFFRKST
jgi:hypothetical protein